MNKTYIIRIFIFSVIQLCNTTVYSKSHDKKDYIDIESKYYMGEYLDCSLVGDSIIYIENIYDAMIQSYSALANYYLAFADRQFNPDDNTYNANFYRARMKARDALEYIFSDLNSNRNQKISQKNIQEKLQSYLLAVLCSRILQIPQYKQVVSYINDMIVPLKETLGNKYCVEKLQISYFEIIYAIDHKQEDYVYEVLLPTFEKEVSMLQSLESVQKARIANIYVQLSEYLNYEMMSTENTTERLKDMVINTMIHSRDYSLYSKKTKNNSSFILMDWKQLKNELRKDEIALLYFTYARDSDSWNYIWKISANIDPSLSYGGHSYWSESQGMSSIRELIDYKKIFVVGTNSMKFSNFSNDNRIVRLHSFSEISNRKISYNNGNVSAIGNINYTYGKASFQSSEKGIKNKVGSFVSAERELKSLKAIFGDKIEIYQGNDVTKSKFNDFEKDVCVLHISTHGTFNKKLLSKYNRENPTYGITGDNIFKSCGLMLSGYNNNEELNFISAYEIKKLDLRNVDFVFVSACESAAGLVLSIGDYSLAEAFHVAGVKNIIAVIDPINEDVATNFAEILYREIKKGTSYHDSFHIAKKQSCPSDRILLFE